MELKNLGSTSLMVPEIGLGTWKHSERELLPYCQEHHIPIITYAPLADGLLPPALALFRSDDSGS